MHGQDHGNVPEVVCLSLHNFRDAMSATIKFYMIGITNAKL
jgi:hypothetical protein